jgi:hypothetical protein
MASSIRDCLDIDDIELKSVDVPEWKTIVYVRTLTRAERHRMFKDNQDVDELLLLVLYACREADGSRAFKKEDLQRLSEKSGKVIERIGRAALDLNGIGSGAVDEAKKNSSVTPN